MMLINRRMQEAIQLKSANYVQIEKQSTEGRNRSSETSWFSSIYIQMILDSNILCYAQPLRGLILSVTFEISLEAFTSTSIVTNVSKALP